MSEKNTVLLYGQAFMLTGMNSDPREIDFRISTQESTVNNEDGTPAVKNYFMKYDEKSGEFIDLAVTCSYQYSVDSQKNRKRIENISWFLVDGKVGVTRQTVQVLETKIK